MRPLAYAKDLAARRRNGGRVGLLVISLHDWEAGQWFSGRPEVARLVLPDDVPVEAADWSPALATDVVLCGDVPDDLFYSVAAAVTRAGAASVWGDFAEGFCLIERGVKLWSATDGPYPPAKFGAALRQFRQAAALLGLGFYRSRIYDPVRAAMLAPMIEALRT